MGFVTGFTGGVTLTLGLTYLAVLAHDRNRQSQAELLRAQTRVLNSLASGSGSSSTSDSAPTPLSRAELGAQHRAHFVETAKDKWNAEIEGAVRWAQTRDWAEARENAEDAAARLLGLARESHALEDGRKRVVDAAGTVREEARRGVVEVRRAAGVVGEETRHRFEDAQNAAGTVRAETRHAFEDAKRTAGEVREETKHMLEDARKTAGETKTAVVHAIEDGIEKGRKMVGRAKAHALLIEESAEARVDARLMHVSDIEKALSERYDSERRRNEIMSKSVEQVLKERYTPIDQRDNSRLRGI
ncbi:hypothetical protein B0T22DRAFT_201193 [Podospora appendiculata]|uniref:MICOS complex subunit MIC12 n=1 Tax=Podospora appendiculata TaxID=314037 RepID=A0AAE1C9W4_9PEZI|nr:hypothetical protein B0T22DRAFT_201193 [Podospora appendiculata]